MLGKNIIHKSTSLVLAITVWCVYSMVAIAAPKDMTGEITVTGQVSVNGQAVVSNSTVVSGSTITTGANSSAIVSLGKAGRVEVLENSELTLKFTENSITGILTSGKARVAENAGIAATITTKDGVAVADAGQANSFAVEVECSHTHIDTVSGLVTLRTGSADKQVAAGTDAVAGNLTQTGCKPCLRPGNPFPVPVAGIGSGALAAILAAVAVGVGLAIFYGQRDGSIDDIGGGTAVVSPVSQ